MGTWETILNTLHLFVGSGNHPFSLHRSSFGLKSHVMRSGDAQGAFIETYLHLVLLDTRSYLTVNFLHIKMDDQTITSCALLIFFLFIPSVHPQHGFVMRLMMHRVLTPSNNLIRLVSTATSVHA